VQTSVFSIGKNHCDNKSDKKTDCKNELTLTEHVDFFYANLDISLEKVVNFPIQIKTNKQCKNKLTQSKNFILLLV
jgi:hypothetical protein